MRRATLYLSFPRRVAPLRDVPVQLCPVTPPPRPSRRREPRCAPAWKGLPAMPAPTPTPPLPQRGIHKIGRRNIIQSTLRPRGSGSTPPATSHTSLRQDDDVGDVDVVKSSRGLCTSLPPPSKQAEAGVTMTSPHGLRPRAAPGHHVPDDLCHANQERTLETTTTAPCVDAPRAPRGQDLAGRGARLARDTTPPV